MESNHFDKIFWFLVGCVAFSFAYATCVTFIPIPKGHERFADAMLSFLLGTVVGTGAFGFLTGRSLPSKSTQTNLPGTSTIDVSATVTTESTENPTTENKNGAG